MSLFNQLSKNPTPAAPAPTNGTPAAAPQEDRAAIEAEKAKLRAEDAARAAPVPKAPCGATGCGQNCQPGWVYTGSAYAQCPACKGEGKAASIGAINPPDAPPAKPLDKADPVTPEALVGADPEIQARAAAISAPPAAATSAPSAAPPVAEVEKSVGGRCPGGNVRIDLTMDQVVARQITCSVCKRTIKIRPGKVGENKYEATIKGHNLPKAEEAPAPPAAVPAAPAPAAVVPAAATLAAPAPPAAVPAAPAPAVAAPVFAFGPNSPEELAKYGKTIAPPSPTSVSAPITVPSLSVIYDAGRTPTTIFLDCAVVCGPVPRPLRDFYGPILESIEKHASVPDIRCAPDGDLSHGKWRGVLSALVRSRQPEPGEYIATSSDEIEMVVVSALRGVRVVRGVR